jgi:hypothetical protein
VTERAGLTRLLLLGGAVGPPLFVIVALIEGATRPGYNPIRNYVSDLAMSSQGWVQVVNFIVCGVLCLAFAVGFRRAVGDGCLINVATILFVLFSLGLIVAGLFTTDPHLDYPPGVPAGRTTPHGAIHGLAGLVVFGSISAAALVLGFYFARAPDWRRWSPWSIVVGVLIPVCFVVFNVTATMDMSGNWPGAPTGLIQRVAIIAGWGWMAALAINLLVSRPSLVFSR